MHREELSDMYCLANFIAGKIKEDDFDGTCGTHTWVTENIFLLFTVSDTSVFTHITPSLRD